MRTIQIPEFSYHSILGAIYETAGRDLANGWGALSDKGTEIAKKIVELNGDESNELTKVEDELTEVGCDCNCDQRDADEIPVYLKADEIKVVAMAVANITFGMIPDDMDILLVHRTIKEVLAYLPPED